MYARRFLYVYGMDVTVVCIWISSMPLRNIVFCCCCCVFGSLGRSAEYNQNIPIFSHCIVLTLWIALRTMFSSVYATYIILLLYFYLQIASGCRRKITKKARTGSFVYTCTFLLRTSITVWQVSLFFFLITRENHQLRSRSLPLAYIFANKLLEMN